MGTISAPHHRHYRPCPIANKAAFSGGLPITDGEFFITVSHYERYKNEIAREVVNMGLRANK